MAKKFRVRLKEYKTNELIGNENTVEYGDLFVEHRPLGTRFLLKHGTENNTSPRALKNIVNQKGFNYVDSGLHVIDAKQFAEYLQGDINEVRVIDLDKYTEGGFYYIRGEANTGEPGEGVILKNSPYSIGLNSNEVNGSEFAGYLQVIEWSSDYCKQIFLKQNNEQIFVRKSVNGNWSDWKEVATSENSNMYKSLMTKADGSINKDLNNYTIKGTYYFGTENTPSNKPDDNDNNGFLIVIHKGLILNQIWFNSNTKNFNYYIRQGVQNETTKEWTLGSWKKILTEDDVPNIPSSTKKYALFAQDGKPVWVEVQ